MKVGILKQLLAGFDNGVEVNFEFSPSDSFKYELDLENNLNFETDCEEYNIQSITLKLKQ